MKVELINDAGEPPKLLRFFGYSVAEFDELCGWFEMLGASGPGVAVQLVPREGVEAADLSQLSAVVANEDHGFVGGASATWALSAERWRVVHDRARALDPVDFASFQWLDQSGSTWVLLSVSGQW